MARLRNTWRAGLGVLCAAAVLGGCEAEPPETVSKTSADAGDRVDAAENPDGDAFPTSSDGVSKLTELAAGRRVISWLWLEPTNYAPGEAGAYIRDRVWLDDQRVRTRDYARFFEPGSEESDSETRVELLGEWVSEPTPLFPVVASLVKAHGELRDELSFPTPHGAVRTHFAYGLAASGGAFMGGRGLETYFEFAAGRGDSLATRVAARRPPGSTNSRRFLPHEYQMLEFYIRLFDARNTLPEDRTYPPPGDEPEGS